MSDPLDPTDPSQPPDNVDPTPEAKVVPLAALQAERQRASALADKLRLRDEADAEKARQEAEARGEHQRLYTEEKAKREALEAEVAEKAGRLSAYEKREAAQREARIAALPEDYRDLIPEGLTDEALDRHLDRVEARVKAAPVEPRREADVLARSGGGGGDPEQLTEGERRWWAGFDGGKNPGTSEAVIRRMYRKIGPGKTSG